MGRVILFFVLIINLNSAQITSTSDNMAKIRILALLKNTKLDTNPQFKNYFNRTLTHCQQMDRFEYWMEESLKTSNLRNIQAGSYLLSTFKDARKEDLAYLYLLLKELKIDESYINNAKSTFLIKAENVNVHGKFILNTSSNNKPKLTLPKKITFRKIRLPAGNYETLEIIIRNGSYGGRIYTYSEIPEYVDTFKHCMRMLMKDYKVDDSSVRIYNDNDRLRRTISPLDLYMRLKSQSGNTNHFYYGGFYPDGDTRKWGNFIIHFEDISGKTFNSSKQRFYLPAADLDILRDLLIVEGISLVTKINFIGVEKVSELKNTENNICKASDYFQNAITATKEPTALLKKMDEVLKINKNHFSAILVKEFLQKKIPVRISLKSSFEIFESLYSQFRKKHDLQWVAHKATNDQNSSNYRALKSLVDKINKYKSKSHPNMSASFNELSSCAESFFDIFESIKNKKPVNPGAVKSYYSQLRNINYSWNLILDSQKLLDEIFK